jgi:hypothetical protein
MCLGGPPLLHRRGGHHQLLCANWRWLGRGARPRRRPRRPRGWLLGSAVQGSTSALERNRWCSTGSAPPAGFAATDSLTAGSALSEAAHQSPISRSEPEEKHGAEEWISINITDPRFVFRTKRHTQGLIDVRLGRDCFDKAGIWFGSGSGRPSVGQKGQSYKEVCDGPTAHRSQKAVLGHTSLGVGNLAIQGDPHFWDGPARGTTINSLAMARPFGDLPGDVLLGWQEVQAVPLGRRRALASLVARVQLRIRLKRRFGIWRTH